MAGKQQERLRTTDYGPGSTAKGRGWTRMGFKRGARRSQKQTKSTKGLLGYLTGSSSVMKGTGDHEVVIEFEPWAADVVRGRQWHSSQQVTDLPGGGSRMTMRLSCLEEVER
jgi:hypothetical protein